MVVLGACALPYPSLIAVGSLLHLIFWSFGAGAWGSTIAEPIEHAGQSLGVLFGWTLLALWVVFLSWLFRTANNARKIGGAESCPAGAEAVACWLIPLINFIVPYLHMQAIWQASHGAEKSSFLPYAWWALCMCYLGLIILMILMILPGTSVWSLATIILAERLTFLAMVTSIQRAHEARCGEP